MSQKQPDALHVLALDPGERVGWARAYVLPNETGEVTDLTHGITRLKDMALALHANVNKYDVLIYETWRLNPAKAREFTGSDFPSVQFVGMVRLAAWLNPQVKLVSQGPSIKNTAQKTAPDYLREVLDRMPKTHDDAHDGDAILHLWHWAWQRFVTVPTTSGALA